MIERVVRVCFGLRMAINNNNKHHKRKTRELGFGV